MIRLAAFLGTEYREAVPCYRLFFSRFGFCLGCLFSCLGCPRPLKCSRFRPIAQTCAFGVAKGYLMISSGSAMHWSREKAVVWMAGLAFVAATAIGPWLHFLPGLGHSCHQCGWDGSAGTVANGHSGTALQSVAIGQPADADDCPICQFFSLAKGLDYRPFALDCGLAIWPASCVQARLVSANACFHYHARAPPVIG